MIYAREAQGYADYDARIQGVQNAGGSTERKEQIGFGAAGESVPYAEVYQSYRDDAMRALETDDIPHGMQELIKEYFSSLE